jgi:hypothetical protein
LLTTLKNPIGRNSNDMAELEKDLQLFKSVESFCNPHDMAIRNEDAIFFYRNY